MSSQRSFTFNVAYESDRRNARIRPGLLTSSPVVDHIQGFLSIITGMLIMLIYWLGSWILLPGLLILGLRKCRTAASESNISLTGDGSSTAIFTLMFRSLMAQMNAGGPDSLAPLLMKQKSILRPVWGGGLWTKMYLFLQKVNFYLVKRILQEQTTYPKGPTGGGCTYLQCRTCWFDDCVEAFLQLHQGNRQTLSS